MKSNENAQDRTLFRLSRTGGCAAKVGPTLLKKLIGSLMVPSDANLLVGFSGNEDAAIYRLDSEKALAFTMDVIAPPVSDPDLYGQIAACNALSDVYAMGAKPLICLNFLGIPEGIPCAIPEAILAGAVLKIQEAGALLVGGHTVKNDQLLFGLAVVGLVCPEAYWPNSAAREGDALVLTKPLGMGVLFSAFRSDHLPGYDLRDAIRWATTLNRAAADILCRYDVHAVTDVTGFGLIGHLMEMAEFSKVTCCLNPEAVPVMARAKEMYEQGVNTGITSENIASVASRVVIPKNFPNVSLQILLDPQTNGGLLASVSYKDAPLLVRALQSAGLNEAAIIGRVEALGEKSLIVT